MVWSATGTRKAHKIKETRKNVRSESIDFFKKGEGRDTESRKKMKRKSPHATHLQMTSGGRMLGWHPFCRGKILIVNHNDVEQSVLVLVG